MPNCAWEYILWFGTLWEGSLFHRDIIKTQKQDKSKLNINNTRNVRKRKHFTHLIKLCSILNQLPILQRNLFQSKSKKRQLAVP